MCLPSVTLTNDLAFTPKEPTAAPEEVSGEPVGPRELRLSWKPLDPTKRNSKRLSGYKVALVKARRPDSEKMEIDVPGDNPTVVVRNLDIWTEYRVTVLAYNEQGDGPASSPILVRTDEDGR